jgi:lipase chaperone LimK
MEERAPVVEKVTPADAGPAPSSKTEIMAPPSLKQEPPHAPEKQKTMFSMDSQGQLVTDEQTRLNIEKLVALNSPEELEKKLQDLSRTLSASAAQRLRELVERFQEYQTAARQVAPPGRPLSSEQEALTLIDTLHGLRVQYFGPEVAQAFFGEEESKQRQLVELMRVQRDPSLTMQERAEKAQALYFRKKPQS